MPVRGQPEGNGLQVPVSGSIWTDAPNHTKPRMLRQEGILTLRTPARTPSPAEPLTEPVGLEGSLGCERLSGGLFDLNRRRGGSQEVAGDAHRCAGPDDEVAVPLACEPGVTRSPK